MENTLRRLSREVAQDPLNPIALEALLSCLNKVSVRCNKIYVIILIQNEELPGEIASAQAYNSKKMAEKAAASLMLDILVNVEWVEGHRIRETYNKLLESISIEKNTNRSINRFNKFCESQQIDMHVHLLELEINP